MTASPVAGGGVDLLASRRKQAEAYQFQASSFRALAEACRLEGDAESAGFYEAIASQYDGFAGAFLRMADNLAAALANIEGAST